MKNNNMDRFSSLYSSRGNAIEGSAIRAILAVTQRSDIISFAGGLPSEQTIPAELIKQLTQEILTENPYPTLQYSLTEGLTHFRQFLADWINKRYKTTYTIDEVRITTGSQQAIDLVADALINPGDIVLIERPTYLAALQIFRKVGARFVEAECDEDGMIPESAEKLLKENKVKLIYTVPDHQNPSGVELSLDRRKKLAGLAQTYTVPLFEDGAYREIRFEDQPLPPIASFDNHTNRMVLFAQTASKILAPGLRIGWIFGPKELLEKMTLLKQSVDVHTSGLDQEIVYRYLSQGHFDTQIKKICALYKTQARAMNKALEAYGKDVFEWQMPKGGLFIWGKVKKNIDTTEKLKEIVETYKVAYVPGATFYGSNPDKQTLRLNFSKATEEQIGEGVSRLSKAFE